MEHRVQIALGDDRVSVKHLVCWLTLLRGRLTRFTLFSVAVSHGSTLFNTTFGDDRGAKAAADAGSKTVGILTARKERCSVRTTQGYGMVSDRS